MWNEVLVEREIETHPRVRSILSKVRKTPLIIESYDDFWGQSKKPYLHKRDSLNLYLARKKGQLVKEAPPAYGRTGEPHFYFIHAYNCVYECQYCYLQGYFNSPDIVLFVNHEDIMAEMEGILGNYPDQRVWFHAGEFSDSLALSHLTGELELYHDFCARHPNAFVELRTKAVNVRPLLELTPLPNLIVSFSLSPEEMARKIDLKTPSVGKRIECMKTLVALGFTVAAHFDPIIFEDNFRERYQELWTSLGDLAPRLLYLSLGVVRFTKDVYRDVQRNYPDSLIHTFPLTSSFDGKVRYHRPLRMWMMNSIKEMAMQSGIPEERIYLCMEDDA